MAEIMTNYEAKSLLQDVARMAVSAGKDIKKGAGYGYVGLLDGKVVKLATHYKDRHGDWKNNKQCVSDSCEALREALGEALNVLSGNDLGVGAKKTLHDIRKRLGLSTNPNETVTKKPLLTRSVVLKAAQDIAKLIGNERLLNNVTGEATIKDTGAKGLETAMGDIVRQQEDFVKGMLRPLLEKMLPGTANEKARNAVLARAEKEFVMRDGELGVRGTTPEPKPSHNDAANAIIGGKATEDAKFSEMFAAFFNAVGKGKTLNGDMKLPDSWSNLAKVTMPAREEVLTLKAPKLAECFGEYGMTEDAKFANFKSLAIVHAPKIKDEGGKQVEVYSNYNSWLLHAAAKCNNTDVASLSLDDMVSFVMSTNDASKPSKLATEGGYEIDKQVMWQSMTPKQYLDIQNCAESAQKDAVKNKLLTLMFRGDGATKSQYFTPVHKQTGGLVSEYTETFKAGNRDVTSVITPKRTRTNANDQLQNLALTTLTDTDNKKLLFKGLRFGSVDMSDKKPEVQKLFYGQLVEQTLLSMGEEYFGSFDEKEEIDLPMVRVDMSDDQGLATFAETYEIKLSDGETVTVRPNVLHFRIPTDNAQVCPVDGGDAWCVLSADDVKQNKEALDGLKKLVKEKFPDLPSPKVQGLMDKIEEDWNSVLEHRTDKNNTDSPVLFYEKCGADMMRLGSMIAVLTNELSLVPSFNCNGGRDRTGLMDVECKTLATWLADNANGGLDNYRAGEPPELTRMRREVRDKSGNQMIARQILLNDQDMLMQQALGSAKKRKNDPTKNEVEIPSFMKDHSSGLDSLYSVGEEIVE